MTDEPAIAADPKPKTRARKSTGKATGRKKSLTSTIEASLLIPATMLESFDPICGGTFKAQVPELAAALNTLAQKDPKVYKFFAGITEVGGWAGVALALAPVGMAVAQHHVFPILDRRAGAQYDEPEEASHAGTNVVAKPAGYVNPNQVISE